jgi:hypothetical protein
VHDAGEPLPEGSHEPLSPDHLIDEWSPPAGNVTSWCSVVVVVNRLEPPLARHDVIVRHAKRGVCSDLVRRIPRCFALVVQAAAQLHCRIQAARRAPTLPLYLCGLVSI